MSPKLVYIAGKYTAPTPEEIAANVAAAVEVGRQVRALGLVPIVPHIVIVPDAALSWDAAMAECLPILERCDAVLFVPGWEASKGARKEAIRALCKGIPMFESTAALRAWRGAAA